MDIERIRRKVAAGAFDIKLHARRHMLKEDFTESDIVTVVTTGLVVEGYPERRRVLF